MKNQIKMLKVKIKSLADETRNIRLEERRALAGGTKYRDEVLYTLLRVHRILDVRSEARCALLAYGFLRGRRFDQIERPIKYRNQNPDWDRVGRMVAKFGSESGRENVGRLAAEGIRKTLIDWTDGKVNPHARPVETKTV